MIWSNFGVLSDHSVLYFLFPNFVNALIVLIVSRRQANGRASVACWNWIALRSNGRLPISFPIRFRNSAKSCWSRFLFNLLISEASMHLATSAFLFHILISFCIELKYLHWYASLYVISRILHPSRLSS